MLELFESLLPGVCLDLFARKVLAQPPRIFLELGQLDIEVVDNLLRFLLSLVL
jgi:hypothetical protein